MLLSDVVSNLKLSRDVTRKTLNTSRDVNNTSKGRLVHSNEQEFARKRDSITRYTLLAFRFHKCLESPWTVTTFASGICTVASTLHRTANKSTLPLSNFSRFFLMPNGEEEIMSALMMAGPCRQQG
jgi:hypothetical protein